MAPKIAHSEKNRPARDPDVQNALDAVREFAAEKDMSPEMAAALAQCATNNVNRLKGRPCPIRHRHG